MDGQEAKKIVRQIKNIILSRPQNQEAMLNSPEWQEVQEAMTYLSSCIEETNRFIKNISVGNLDAMQPSRMNFMAGELKELQSNLRHMTWQANQVANGDYNQRLRFLGEFSSSFNTMVERLNQREFELKQITDDLTRSTELLELIMDGLTEIIVVTSLSDCSILYLNSSARDIFCSDLDDEDGHKCGDKCEILNCLKNRDFSNKEPVYIECPVTKRNYKCRFCMINWNGIDAVAHIISDITKEQDEKEELERMAFKDELTGVYNRRYFMNKIEHMLKEKQSFSICSIDIDELKYANDTFGHIAGDEYIKAVADAMMGSIRTRSDIVCRVGGDEFVIVLPSCPEDIAIKKAEQIAEKISSQSKDYPMGISFGVYYVDNKTTLSLEEIISIADARMYKLKKKHKQIK